MLSPGEHQLQSFVKATFLEAYLTGICEDCDRNRSRLPRKLSAWRQQHWEILKSGYEAMIHLA